MGVTCYRSQELMLGVLFYIICFQFITFEHAMLYSSYWAWFIALLASTYAALFCTCFCFWLNLLVHLTSAFNLSCNDLCQVRTKGS